MPFASEAQRKKCYALYNKDIKAGRTPKWDCNAWEKETKREIARTGKKLPEYKQNKSSIIKNKSKTKKSKTKSKTKSRTKKSGTKN
jgi:hypothetical protein